MCIVNKFQYVHIVPTRFIVIANIGNRSDWLCGSFPQHTTQVFDAHIVAYFSSKYRKLWTKTKRILFLIAR